MFAKYVTNTSCTLAQVIADFAALASGSAIAALSASCDKTASTQTSTIAPGWTLVDAAAAGSGQVVSAPDATATTTKYARLYANTTSSVDVLVYESWNAATHVGTNASTTMTSAQVTVTPGVAMTYWVVITPRLLWITSVSNGALGVLEISRDAAYLAGAAYPAAVAIGNNLAQINTMPLAMSRVKKTQAAGDTTGATLAGTTYLRPVSLGAFVTSGGTLAGPNGLARDAAEASYYPLVPLWIGVIGDSGTNGGAPYVLGKVYDASLLNGLAGALMDTISDGTDSYLLAAGTTNSWVLLKVA